MGVGSTFGRFAGGSLAGSSLYSNGILLLLGRRRGAIVFGQNGRTIRCKTVCNVPTVSLGAHVDSQPDQSSENPSSDDESESSSSKTEEEDEECSSGPYSSRSSMPSLNSRKSTPCSSRSSSRGSSASSCSSRTSFSGASDSSLPSQASSSSHDDVFDGLGTL